MDKEDVIYIYNGLLLNHKKEWKFAICNNMDGPRGYYAKWNKSDRERQIPYNFIYVWNLKSKNKETNITQQKHTHRCRELMVARGAWGGGMNEIGEGD